MKKALQLTLLFAFFATAGFSQSDRYWSANSESQSKITTDKAVARLSFPKEFKLFNLNIDPFRQTLFTTVGKNAIKHSTVISLPNADGNFEQFEIFEASNFEPDLQAQFPMIRAFSGKGITDKYARLKMSIAPNGIKAMVFRTDKDNEFIEPYSNDHRIYAVFKSQRVKGGLPWTCSTDEHQSFNDLNAQIAASNRPTSSAGELKTMRLAQSCNGEYSNYFGATSATDVALVLAAFNATLTRCNGVYETDLALHLNLIANTADVIYYNPATDPYTTLGAWNGQLQTTLTNVIGAANYDIGHMFGASGGGGNAGCIGCVCGAQKGSGITSPADGIPEGDNFDIDYVVHEVGHQLGANHTFSMGLEGSGVNKEVGSGITIMGYAGITNQDVAPHSIDIFHEASIQQIQNNLATKTCPITTNITATNATPVVAPVSNYTIPKSTPFALTGSATDANAGDALTYCWEQNDNSTVQGNASVASPTKVGGPNWLSFRPTANPIRTCPILPTILAGNFITGPLPGGDAIANIEALSSVARTLNFRLTVRDNSPYSSTVPLKVGQTSFTDMTVTVDATSGPFLVTQPNTNVTWPGGSTQTITWDVANSTAAPVSCANVRILLSIDGGQTFPTVLVATTANDGTETVTIPGTATTTARVKVESIGNIFFDISNSNFTISAPASGYAFNSVAPATVSCAGPATATITLATTSLGGFVTPVNLTAAGAPAGTTVSFSVNPVVPGNSTEVTLSNANTLSPGTYDIIVTGVAGAITQNSTLSFTVQPGTPPSITSQPAAIAVCSGDNAVFTVAAAGTGLSYQWQVSTAGGAFTDIIGANAATYTIATTTALNNNQYHVIVSYQCGTTTSSDATLTINTAANITTQPTGGAPLCAGDNYTFNVAATGTSISYQWQVSTDGGLTYTNIAGATNNSYSITGVTTALNGNLYQVSITSASAACPAPAVSVPVSITVNPLPVIAATADAIAVCTATPVVLTATGAGTGGTYTWAPGGLTGASVTVTPQVLPASPGVPNPIQYTATGTNSFGCVGTSSVTVTANPLPVVTLTATPANAPLIVGQTVLLKANVTPAGVFTYTWDRNGLTIPNTTDSLRVGITELGEYGVTVSDITGLCGSSSNKVTVIDSITNKFYIYPNPNDGQFNIVFKNPNIVGNVTVFDSRGARVYANIEKLVRTAYQQIAVDLRPAASGVYIVVIYDKSGVRLATEKVVVRQ